MRLTKDQLEQFDREGYLFFPGLFSPRETTHLLDAVPELYSRREAYNVREKGSDAVRTNFAAHLVSEPFARLARHPRMVGPVMDLFNEEVYMHQFKINGKMAFEGDVWQWHQDYGTWLNDDMMPTERAMNVAIFLDDVNEYNGPLMFIPGSHKKGVVEAKHDLTTTSYPLWTVDNDLIAQAGGPGRRQERRHRQPQGPGRLDDPVPQLPGACVHQQPVALEPRQRLPEPVRGLQPHPPLQAPRVHRAPRLHAHRLPARRLPAAKPYPVDVPWKDGMPASALQTSLVPFAELKEAA
jgi:ectoine hydroxylase